MGIKKKKKRILKKKWNVLIPNRLLQKSVPSKITKKSHEV